MSTFGTDADESESYLVVREDILSILVSYLKSVSGDSNDSRGVVTYNDTCDHVPGDSCILIRLMMWLCFVWSHNQLLVCSKQPSWENSRLTYHHQAQNHCRLTTIVIRSGQHLFPDSTLDWCHSRRLRESVLWRGSD